jgi:hypothetical protein
MPKRSLATASIFLLALGLLIGAAQAQPETKTGPNDRAAPGTPSSQALPTPVSASRVAPTAIGTIIYDNGVVTATPSISSYMFGNQFNTRNGNPVLATGTVTQMSFFILTGAGGDNVFISLYGPPSGTVAPFIDDQSVPLNNGSGSFNTAPFGPPNMYSGGSFLAGVWYVAGDTVGLGSGTVNGQGHHGIAINDIVGTDFQTVPGLNAIVGATGEIIVPVELMGFSVDE